MKSYQNLLAHIIDNGEEHNDRTGVGTLSVFGYQFVHYMASGFPLLTTKKLPFRWIAEELFWFLSGSTNEKDLAAKGVDIWQEWATKEKCAEFGREEGDLGPVYGHLWRNFTGTDEPGSDQIKSLYDGIQNDCNSRRLLVSGWHPVKQKQVALPPCHTLWQIKVHWHHKMSMHLYARSIDSFLGLPFNIASYALLLHLIAHTTGHIPHKLVISFGDLHLYKNHFDQAAVQLAREPRTLPKLEIDNRLYCAGLDGLLSCEYKDLYLTGYDPHSKIEADVAI